MSEWILPRERDAEAVPEGFAVAGLGRRSGAWLIDAVVLYGIPYVLAFVIGAARPTQAFIDAAESGVTDPSSLNAPMLEVDVQLLVGLAIASVAFAVLYGILGWTLLGGTPAQRLLSLQVVEAGTGRRLSAARAAVRWAALYGLSFGTSAVGAVVLFRLLAVVPISAVGTAEMVNAPGLRNDPALSAWYGATSVLFSLSAIWMVALLITALADPRRRGVHDRLARSIVVRPKPVVWPAAWAWPYASWPGAGGPGPLPPGPYPGPYPPATPYPGSFSPGSYSPGAFPAPYPPVTPPGSPPVPESNVPAETPAAAGLAPAPPAPPSAPDAPMPEAPAASRPTPESFGDPHGPGPDVPTRPGPPGRTALPVGRPGSGRYPLPAGLRIAVLGTRGWAYLIDSGIVLALFEACIAVAGALGYETQTDTPGFMPRGLLLAGVLGAIAQILYFVPSWVLLRGTLGQRMLGLQVGNAQTGKRLGWVDAFIRWIVLQGPFALYSAVPVPLNTLVLLFAAVWMPVLLFSASQDPDGRGLHDRIAGSLVVSGA